MKLNGIEDTKKEGNNNIKIIRVLNSRDPRSIRMKLQKIK